MAKTEPRTNHSATDEFAKSAHETVDVLAGNAAYAEQKIRAVSSSAKENYRNGKARIREKSSEVSDGVRGYVGDSPFAALGISFAAGLLISTLIRK